MGVDKRFFWSTEIFLLSRPRMGNGVKHKRITFIPLATTKALCAESRNQFYIYTDGFLSEPVL